LFCSLLRHCTLAVMKDQLTELGIGK
jgi:hypothetical protein